MFEFIKIQQKISSNSLRNHNIIYLFDAILNTHFRKTSINMDTRPLRLIEREREREKKKQTKFSQIQISKKFF